MGGIRVITMMAEIFGVLVLFELDLKWLQGLWFLFSMVMLDRGIFSHLIAIQEAGLAFNISAYRGVAHYFEWKTSIDEVELLGRAFRINEVIIDPSIILERSYEAVLSKKMP